MGIIWSSTLIIVLLIQPLLVISQVKEMSDANFNSWICISLIVLALSAIVQDFLIKPVIKAGWTKACSLFSKK
jgi:hypothetical protein